MDVASFLERFPPFDALTPDRLAELAGQARLLRFPDGTTIVRQGGEPSPGLYVVHEGAVELLDDGRVLDLLGAGEVFGLSAVTEAGPTATVRAHGDTSCYLIPSGAAEDVVGTDAGRSFVLGTFRGRERRRRQAELDAVGAPERRFRRVGELVHRGPVWADASTPVRDVAALMTRERVSNVLVRVGDGTGIVTDRDLRTKVVAAGVDAATPVGTIASRPARTIGAGSIAADALVRMFAEDVHHFPVVDDDGRVLGVVTEGDLLEVGEGSPFALRGRIERARTAGEVAAAGRDLPGVVVELVDASADPVDVGRVAALAIDAMTRRLLELAFVEHGDPPVGWAWLALGSAARREQALRTDQDHALAYDDGAGDVDPYFARVAAFVTDGLADAGIARCPGDVMATHPSLRRSVASWSEAMHTWMQDLSPRGSELSSIVYDYRRVAGPLDVEPALDAVVREARARPGFLRALGRRALELRPPTGFVRDLVVERHGEHAGHLDVKRGGITIVGNLARVQAVASGVAARGTMERLGAGGPQAPLVGSTAAELVEAFGFLWELRLRHQVEQVHAGVGPDEFLDPSTLGPVARTGLKEAFRVIARAQRELATAMGLRTP